jgi:hypothetical protein
MGIHDYPAIVATQRLSKHIPVATKNCCRGRFLCSSYRIKGNYAIISSKNVLFFMFLPRRYNQGFHSFLRSFLRAYARMPILFNDVV